MERVTCRFDTCFASTADLYPRRTGHVAGAFLRNTSSMPTYWTVKENSAGQRIDVPSDSASLRAALEDENIGVYVYIGVATDLGWQVARAMTGLLLGTDPWLVDDITALSEWLPEDKRQDATVKAVAFGYDTQPDFFLSKEDAEDTVKVQTAIRTAN